MSPSILFFLGGSCFFFRKLASAFFFLGWGGLDVSAAFLFRPPSFCLVTSPCADSARRSANIFLNCISRSLVVMSERNWVPVLSLSWPRALDPRMASGFTSEINRLGSCRYCVPSARKDCRRTLERRGSPDIHRHLHGVCSSQREGPCLYAGAPFQVQGIDTR